MADSQVIIEEDYVKEGKKEEEDDFVYIEW